MDLDSETIVVSSILVIKGYMLIYIVKITVVIIFMRAISVQLTAIVFGTVMSIWKILMILNGNHNIDTDTVVAFISYKGLFRWPITQVTFIISSWLR